MSWHREWLLEKRRRLTLLRDSNKHEKGKPTPKYKEKLIGEKST